MKRAGGFLFLGLETKSGKADKKPGWAQGVNGLHNMVVKGGMLNWQNLI
ncbi:MAG: hypothetical protein ACOX4Q_01525 [Syntrophomonadales bacterium]